MEDSNQEVVRLLISINKWMKFFGWMTIAIIALWTISYIMDLQETSQAQIQYEYENRTNE